MTTNYKHHMILWEGGGNYPIYMKKKNDTHTHTHTHTPIDITNYEHSMSQKREGSTTHFIKYTHETNANKPAGTTNNHLKNIANVKFIYDSKVEVISNKYIHNEDYMIFDIYT